jgi:hypothetical protein
MNYNGCKRKFNVALFVAKYKGAAENASKSVSSKPKPAVWNDFQTKKKPSASKGDDDKPKKRTKVAKGG